MDNVTVVITSCNRFDLLEKTIESFIKFNTYPISDWIIIEDSHNIKKLKKILNKFKSLNITLLHNDIQLGQMKSIEKAYSHVKTDYIFHCEDDWEFYRHNFIEDSFKILHSNSKIVTVWLREQNDTNEHPIEDKTYYGEDNIQYNELKTDFVKYEGASAWHGFTFNPGLRRLSDYKLIAPISDYENECEVSDKYYKLGYKAAIFKHGYVKHIGFHRGIRYKINKPDWYKDLSVTFRKIKTNILNSLKK
ncbi:glycosyltransferase family A protein [Photobacterium leiognathi]|uniref:Glycosyl transferase n=2 Tax=Photobacterium leiognathi TaxID=553611 RepID=A0A2T3KXW0_PHOLD|nr:glycosyltransferase family A protein [Photobacterium leiognathi]PSV12473.1 glycosyl transferase [Photobacterium leiognathi subsp. mandapamensis]